MKLIYLVASTCLAISPVAFAVVTRHDVPDLKYRIPQAQAQAVANLPHEGHGVLIAPRWILTAAHAATWHPVTEVMLNGKCRKVERLVVHRGYKKLPETLVKPGTDVAPAIAFLAAIDDIALIELAEPVSDVQPVALYRSQGEVGKPMQLIGMGATGNGEEGQPPDASHRTELRRAFNVVSNADTRWLAYVFDAAPGAHPLEGMSGNGDSGGPILIEEDGQWKLAGLTSWVHATGKVGEWKPGRYGSTAFAVRVSRYLDWIGHVLAAEAPAARGMGGR